MPMCKKLNEKPLDRLGGINRCGKALGLKNLNSNCEEKDFLPSLMAGIGTTGPLNPGTDCEKLFWKREHLLWIGNTNSNRGTITYFLAECQVIYGSLSPIYSWAGEIMAIFSQKPF